MNNSPKNVIKCLDQGFIRLVDSMGGDDSIVQAARVSYGKGTKKVSQDTGLIRYLMRHRHTTPFEMVEFKFHCKMPIFVARQWVRHRTANINEYSLRYSEARDEFYIPNPKNISTQSALNKQGRGMTLSKKDSKLVIDNFEKISSLSYKMYEEMNEKGIARELARAVLPVNLYTEWYWKNDLNNTLKFLSLRMDSHAQYEIRVYAEAMAEFVKQVTPIAYQAFEDYNLSGFYLSSFEQDIFKQKLPERLWNDIYDDVVYRIVYTLNKNKARAKKDLYPLYVKNGGDDDESTFNTKWKTETLKTGNVRELREFQNKLKNLIN
jgi:thymidylate synthase (FAD)|tara:strand:+ start:7419 stop:8381 length:963 start_codon:yes stop_codon:yes gene_type:complete